MPIPRMTVEDQELEEQYHLRRKLARIPKHKRWLVALMINCFLAWERIEKLIIWKE